jgi:hypothetical protein
LNSKRIAVAKYITEHRANEDHYVQVKQHDDFEQKMRLGAKHHPARSRHNSCAVRKLTAVQVAARKFATLIPAVLQNRKLSNRQG